MSPPIEKLTAGRFIRITLIAWLAFLGVDFLVHGALLRSWYERGDPVLLPLTDAFIRIPLGYAGFLLITGLVVWLVTRLELSGWRDGLLFGLLFGAVAAASHGLGLVSITRIDATLAAWWAVSEAIELGIVGAIVGEAALAPRLGRLFLRVAGIVAVLVIIAIALQNV